MIFRLIRSLLTLLFFFTACSSNSSSSLCESDDQCSSFQQCSSEGACKDKTRDREAGSEATGELIIDGDDMPLSGEMITEEVTAGDSSAGDSSAGDSSAGDSSAGDSSAGDSSAGDSSAGDSSAGDSSAGDSSAGDSSAGDSSAGDSSAGDSSAGDSSAGDSSAGIESSPILPCVETLCLESVQITDDENDDGVISPGESAVLNYFTMRNEGTEDIEDLTGIISTSSPYLTFRTERLSFTPGSSHSYLNADDNRDNNDRLCPADDDCGQATAIGFEISLDAPIGEEIIIEFDLTDELNRDYHLEYALPVAAHNVNLELAELIVARDSNDDGRLSPGESARISYFKMRNTGTSNIIDLSGVISCESPYLNFRTERLSFTPGSSHYFSTATDNDDNSDGECPAGGDCGQATSIRFEINPNAPIGALIPLEFDLIDRFGHRFHLEYRLYVEDVDINLEFVNAVVTDDSNRDGALSPGESAVLTYFMMRNSGASDVVGLQGMISSQSTYLRFNSERLSFTPGSVHQFLSADDNDDNNDGECPSNGDCGQATAIYFELTSDTPIGEVILIEFDLFDRLNNEYHFEYPLLVEEVDVSLELFELIITGSQTFDGLSPGESATLNYFSVRNNGSTDATGLRGVISSDSPNLSLRSERLSFTPGSSHSYVSESNNQDNSDGLCPASNDCGQATDIRFSISESALPGQVVNLIFNLTDEFNNSYRFAYPIEVQ